MSPTLRPSGAPTPGPTPAPSPTFSPTLFVTANQMDLVECCDCVEVTSGKPGCRVDRQCETRICEIDTYCCNNEWDKTCVEAAQNLCYLTSQTTAVAQDQSGVSAGTLQDDLMDVIWKFAVVVLVVTLLLISCCCVLLRIRRMYKMRDRKRKMMMKRKSESKKYNKTAQIRRAKTEHTFSRSNSHRSRSKKHRTKKGHRLVHSNYSFGTNSGRYHGIEPIRQQTESTYRSSKSLRSPTSNSSMRSGRSGRSGRGSIRSGRSGKSASVRRTQSVRRYNSHQRRGHGQRRKHHRTNSKPHKFNVRSPPQSHKSVDGKGAGSAVFGGYNDEMEMVDASQRLQHHQKLGQSSMAKLYQQEIVLKGKKEQHRYVFKTNGDTTSEDDNVDDEAAFIPGPSSSTKRGGSRKSKHQRDSTETSIGNEEEIIDSEEDDLITMKNHSRRLGGLGSLAPISRSRHHSI